MQSDGSLPAATPPSTASLRAGYEAEMQAIRAAFESQCFSLEAGVVAVEARAVAVDALVQALWSGLIAEDSVLSSGLALVAVGGYGRSELFPQSDIDLVILLDARVAESDVKGSIGRLSQAMWDCGLRVSPMTRTLRECAHFDAENVEFTLALLDARHVAGDAALTGQLTGKTVNKILAHDRKKCIARLISVTELRHGRYGETVFHLEPNVKECPGGLRDAHVCEWLTRLSGAEPAALPEEFVEARRFLVLVRTFLHLRHGRDDNTLDWQTQDEAAASGLGTMQRTAGTRRPSIDPAFWMRLYFRHARAIERRNLQMLDEFAPPRRDTVLPAMVGVRRPQTVAVPRAFDIRNGRILFSKSTAKSAEIADDPAHHPEVVLAIFGAVARTGAALPLQTESRIEDALPVLSAQLEDGPALWQSLQAILTGPFAGRALRGMHALGVLELLIPEFHGIDALVIRDAYHRYTVDEHTFVVIDTLHALDAPITQADPWASRFAGVLRDLPHPELLFLAALLHDTGKGHATSAHAQESARMAKSVVARLEVEPYAAGLVLDIVRNHLEMSAALRRDVFDAETIRSFAERVPTPEALRMLALFTYADITAVHPDALTPWKAENLWRLYLATLDFLDRNVDEERVASAAASELGEVVQRVHALLPERTGEVAEFLGGLPRRYLLTRTPEQIRTNIEMAGRLAGEPNQLDFRYAPGLSELTLITRDRPKLFASMAGVLAAWGMNIVTADAFSNGHGVAVDSFRFADTFRTLEMNESERGRFVESIAEVMSGRADLDAMLSARRRGRRLVPKVKVEARVDFDDRASTQSTLLQVVAQDTPGLLRALSLTLAEQGCNIEVALVDTEGEMAIDVFYVTQAGQKLEAGGQERVRRELLAAIASNARSAFGDSRSPGSRVL